MKSQVKFKGHFPLNGYFKGLQPLTQTRAGLSRIEVIVLLGIVALLCAVFVPSLVPRRAQAREMTCLDHLRQNAIGILEYDSQFKQLPDLVTPLKVPTDTDPQHELLVGWPVSILPFVGNASLLQSIKEAVQMQPEQRTLQASMIPPDRRNLIGFRCPDAAAQHNDPGALSYVANFGFIDEELFDGDPKGLHRLGGVSWNANEILDEEQDVQVSAATGVIWRPSTAYKPTLDEVSSHDGTTQTILLSENLQAGTWFSTETTELGFGVAIPTTKGQVLFGKGQFFDSASLPLNTQFGASTLRTAKPRDWDLNAKLDSPRGTKPRPSSLHKGRVHIIFCDGSVRQVDEKIDRLVYLKLLTSNGREYGEASFSQ